MRIFVLILFGSIIPFENVFGSNTFDVKANADSSALVVHLQAPENCKRKQTVAWISIGRTLLYQADVSPNGSFEVHTNPGEYNIVVTGESGCSGEQAVSVATNEVKEFTLVLTSPKSPAPKKERP